MFHRTTLATTCRPGCLLLTEEGPGHVSFLQAEDMCTVNSWLCTVSFMNCSLFWPLNNWLFVEWCLYCTLNSSLCIVWFVHFTFFCITNSVQCAWCTVLSSVHCTGKDVVLYSTAPKWAFPCGWTAAIGKKKRSQFSKVWGCTQHCTLDTVHSTLHTRHCTLNTAHMTLHTQHCTLDIAHTTLHTRHCTLNSAQCILYKSQLNTAHTPQNLYCVVYNQISIVNSVQCTIVGLKLKMQTFNCTPQTADIPLKPKESRQLSKWKKNQPKHVNCFTNL